MAKKPAMAELVRNIPQTFWAISTHESEFHEGKGTPTMGRST
jgi:hypothetical protein